MSNAYHKVTFSELNALAKEAYILKLKNSRQNKLVNTIVNMCYHRIISCARNGQFSNTFRFEGSPDGGLKREELLALKILDECFPGVHVVNNGPKSITFMWN